MVKVAFSHQWIDINKNGQTLTGRKTLYINYLTNHVLIYVSP